MIDEDGDGRPDGIDYDGDGIIDGPLPGGKTKDGRGVYVDIDGDGIPDGVDYDGDGRPDGAGPDGRGTLVDVDGDGIPDGIDYDGDGRIDEEIGKGPGIGPIGPDIITPGTTHPGQVIDPMTGEKVDLDECELMGHMMCKNGRCINTMGSFKCECNRGFRYDDPSHMCVGKD